MRRMLHRAAASARRRLPLPLLEVAAALAARVGDGPGLLPGPPPGPVLCVAPHPDDETIGCGGALARHAERGDEVTVVVASSGEGSGGGARGLTATREHEVATACDALGVGAPHLLRLPDGELAGHASALADALADLGRKAATVYTPSLLDAHRDHRAVNRALARARLDARMFGYEVWSPAPVDALLDVTAVWARKERALAAYASARRQVDYLRTSAGLAAYRSSAGGLGGQGYAEGFLTLPAVEHADLVLRLGE